jgi:predicted nucleic acid-binding protein
MRLTLLDTNIFLRHLVADHPVQSPQATAYFARIEQGEVRVRTTEIVVFETVFNLERWYKHPKAKIRDNLLPLIALPGIILPSKRRLQDTFELYTTLNLPFADAYHVVVMRQFRLTEIVSFDREFDRVPDIARVEPS